MLKKIIFALAMIPMFVAPAYAGDRDDYRGYNRGYGEHHGLSTGGAVALGLGALILGGAIANRNQPRPYQPYNNYNNSYYYNQRQLVCENVYARDYNGNYVLDQYGRAIFTQRCWYQ